MGHIFKGHKNDEELVVLYDGKNINELVGDEAPYYNQQPNWGYVGSGPYQLAYAILKIAAGDEIAKRYYNDFAKEVTTRLPKEWQMDVEEVRQWIKNKDDNIVKRTCKELGITQKELAERLGVHLTTVQKWAASEKIPENAEKSIELLVENHRLKTKLDKFTTAFNLIEEARKQP